jgi:hypothetical protein
MFEFRKRLKWFSSTEGKNKWNCVKEADGQSAHGHLAVKINIFVACSIKLYPTARHRCKNRSEKWARIVWLDEFSLITQNMWIKKNSIIASVRYFVKPASTKYLYGVYRNMFNASSTGSSSRVPEFPEFLVIYDRKQKTDAESLAATGQNVPTYYIPRYASMQAGMHT